jgi:hypothetical protein
MFDLPSSDPSFIVVALIAALTIGLSKGGLPVVAMLSVPLLSQFISPVTAAALTLPIYVVSDIYGIYLYRHHFSRRNLLVLVPAGIGGVCVGWAAFTVVSDRLVVLIIGILGLMFCVTSFVRRRREIRPREADLPRGILFGMMSGFTSFIAHAGAPPYQMYVVPQRLDKLVYAGTSTILFAILNAAKLIPYWSLGQFSEGNVVLGILLVPAALFGAYAGSRIIRVIPQALFYDLVQAALFLLSLKLVWDGITG